MNLRDQIKEDEGLRLKPYDCPGGHKTIGYGWNLDARPLPADVKAYLDQHGEITEAMAEELLTMAIDSARRQCEGIFAYWETFSPRRQDAILNMVYNMGIGTFCEFKKMSRAILRGYWLLAASEAEDSLWFKQVGKRSARIVKELREG